MVQHGTDTPTRRFATRHGTLCCNMDRHGTNTTRARTGASGTRRGPTRGQHDTCQHGTLAQATSLHAPNTRPTRSQHAARDKWLLQKSRISGKKFCPRQRSCPRQVASSKKVGFLRKSSAPGNEAARDELLLQTNRISEKKFCHGQRSCPGQVACSKTTIIFLRESPAQGSEAAQDKWVVQK